MNFPASRRKIERAMKHIHDLKQMFDTFIVSDFYSISVQKQKGSNYLLIDITTAGFSKVEAALVIGDALHNLRSAIDMAYYQAFHETTGITDDRTQFPIRDQREELEAAIDGGLKKKRLSDHPSARKIRDLIVNVIKPYQAGNPTLCALHDINIRDKHQLLIPLFQIMRFTDIRLEDEGKAIFAPKGMPYFTESSYSFKVGREGNLTLKDKGHAATAIVFEVGTSLQNKPVIPALNGIAEEVTRTIDAFEAVGLRSHFQ